MSWHKPYNISGTIHCENRLGELCELLGALLQTTNVGIIGHFTGATTVAASSPIALVLTSGFDLHDVYVLVPGDPENWTRFGNRLEQELLRLGFPFSLVVHPITVNLERQQQSLAD